LEDGVEVEIIWIQALVGLEGNEIVDEQARNAALNGDFQGFAERLAGEVGRCRHS
jgi:hypothetical protein